MPSFGRIGSPYTHRVARCELEKNRIAYALPNQAKDSLETDRLMIMELRGNPTVLIVARLAIALEVSPSKLLEN